ncbi:11140_t:CDS:2 [Paraglomus brasilianum]|uniref:11140_t:CDS:1 n=1 Tax=Paraglomus brasilianum TaxID=144538 RepID=A0A9N9BC05_9GLOM|nr:11140_t:CDS:2 [Paraglomus brasilianum]
MSPEQPTNLLKRPCMALDNFYDSTKNKEKAEAETEEDNDLLANTDFPSKRAQL